MNTEIYQSTDLDYAIAEEFFGWKWMAFMGRPMRSAKDYPESRMVRQFHSPQELRNERWKDYWAENQGREADGTEDLSYRYCSSFGPDDPPHFSGDPNAIAKLEKEIRNRKLWHEYRLQLWAQIGGEGDHVADEERLAEADCEARCIAALAVVGSKFVRMQAAE